MAYYRDRSTQQLTGTITSADLIEQFADPIDCLTAHLMLECSEVLAGVKPANLISVVNRTRSCGKNLYHLWQQYHQQATARISSLRFIVMHDKERALLLFCYDHNQLQQKLDHAGVRTLLTKAGYDAHASCDALIHELQSRIASNNAFPHEIGLFIGYPAKDVAAFMGLVKLPFTCQGPWKIYGSPEKSLHLAQQFRTKRACMSSRLSRCTNVDTCLASLQTNSQLFFASQLIT